MAIPLILAGQVARSILVGGTKHAVKKYGDDVVKQVQKTKEFKKLKKEDIKFKDDMVQGRSKTPSDKFPEYKQSAAEKAANRPSNMRARETQKTNNRNRRLEQEIKGRERFDIDGDPLDGVPLKFSKGGLLEDDRNMYKDGGGPGIEALREEAPEVVERMGYEEGGSLLADDMSMISENIEMSAEPTMESDDNMEDNYLEFIIGKALSEEEEDMLMSKLEQDDEMSIIFDKVIDMAQEFAGSGPVEGPGTGVSDSIPARLSDGEFVFTAKAVEEIGEDVLMSMMKEAEDAAGEREGFAMGGVYDEEEIEDEKSEVSNDMRKVNPRLNPNSR